MKFRIILFVLTATIARSGTLNDSVAKLAVILDRLKAERATYKKNGIWWAKATRSGYPAVDGMVYDDDRAAARKLK